MNPAAVTTSDAVMNGHFHLKKSKFVFLNNSIEPVLPASRWLSSRWFYTHQPIGHQPLPESSLLPPRPAGRS
jgi:hypothetical protein